MLEAVDATRFADQRIGDLSGGQQQRVLIAHALIRRPPLLLLDEPLANLDMRSVAGIVARLRRLSRDFKTTVLLSAHDMNPLLSAVISLVTVWASIALSFASDWPIGFFVGGLSALAYAAGRTWAWSGALRR